MSSFSGLEIGLCFLFVCILLVLSAEMCYLLWWKKKFSNITPYTCWKTSKSTKTQEKGLQTLDSDMGFDKDLVSDDLGHESLDLELMRLHNLRGPPRFLFTINEETKEDLESQRSKKGSRTLSDILDNMETPFLSPIASPPLKLPRNLNLEAYNHHGLNPLFDSSEVGVNKIKSSPPPTFKFLRDAEEKFLKRLMEIEVEKRANFRKNEQDSSRKTEEEDGCFVKLVEEGHHQVSTTITPIDKKW